MRWSKLKKQVEETFAERVQGRVELFVTRYRHAHDGAGEAWITIDGARIECMGEIRYWKHRLLIERRLREELRLASPQEKAQAPQPVQEAPRLTREDEVFSDEDFKEALFDYLNLSIDEIIVSDDPIIRALGMLDRRFGKRRLATFDTKKETALLRRLHAFRCEVEGVTPISAPECS